MKSISYYLITEEHSYSQTSKVASLNKQLHTTNKYLLPVRIDTQFILTFISQTLFSIHNCSYNFHFFIDSIVLTPSGWHLFFSVLGPGQASARNKESILTTAQYIYSSISIYIPQPIFIYYSVTRDTFNYAVRT